MDRYHDALWQGLKRNFSNVFDDKPIVGEHYQGALKLVRDIAQRERKMQLMIRGMTEGVLSERDRLLHYTVGEFYQELSLFVEECDKKKKYMDSLKTRK